MFNTLFNSFLLVALNEMGDKTQLLAFSLTSRFRSPWAIMGGILTATVLNHTLAAFFGSWISDHVPANLLAAILGITFIAFGIWTLKPDTLDENTRPSKFGAFLTTTVLFFLAEMGDKTQLATVALAAKFHSTVLVTAGTTLGMLASDGLAVFLGDKLTKIVPMIWIRRVAAGLFFLFGLISFIPLFRP